jgi:hypothetical protein
LDSIVFITPIAFQRISYRTWIIFAVTNFAILPLVYFFYPETAFRSLEEVDVIFQLAHDAPGNPWLTAVGFSQSEPLWFGKKDPEKRLNFNYANSSWHKRLVESILSRESGSGSNTNSGTTEKRPWSNGESPDSDETAAPTIARERKRSEESPVDPRLHRSPPLSPATTMTTTITSQKRPRRKLQKRNSSASSLASHMSQSQPPPPVFGLYDNSLPAETHQPTMPHHRHTRSTSSDSLNSVRPEWWTDDLTPIPVAQRSRSSSRTGHAMETRGRPSSRISQRSLSNNALNRLVNRDLLAEQQQQTLPRRAASSSSFQHQANDYRPDAITDSESIDYPGMLGGEERGRGRSGIVRTQSERETYLPDGVYEVVEGRVRQISAGPASRPGSVGSGRKYSARDAGFAR